VEARLVRVCAYSGGGVVVLLVAGGALGALHAIQMNTTSIEEPGFSMICIQLYKLYYSTAVPLSNPSSNAKRATLESRCNVQLASIFICVRTGCTANKSELFFFTRNLTMENSRKLRIFFTQIPRLPKQPLHLLGDSRTRRRVYV
jgi:hypothetical protein